MPTVPAITHRDLPTTMQHELKDLERRWGLALQSAAFGVWDLDPRRQRVHYSPEWKQMLGYGNVDEVDSTATWRERVHPDDRAPMVAALEAHLGGREDAYAFEFRLRAADGSYRWVLSRGRVVDRDPGGEPLRMVGTLTDLTDRREMEAMRQARDQAEAANQAKTAFLSRMSHELRTPLNAVLGFAQLLSRQIGGTNLEQQRGYVGHIEQAGWHLLQLINDVLDLSRVESGQLAMESTAVPLAPLWQQVRQMLGPQAAARQVSIRTGTLPADATVRADPVRLRQVLINLLSNAINYNREGGTVTVEAQPDGTGWVFSMADTGVGIPAAQMPHLFEPFNRLGRANAASDGVGIGLTLTRWLVERMGGTIAVASTEGRGTTATLTLQAA
jgi:PAS domain S-box-containing protein